ncbi:hypothetical protein [Methanosarcina acetivorans]|nr:hypothetical protein [Methanosarcina acetivorans]
MSVNDRMNTTKELRDMGRVLKEQVPRSSHGTWIPNPSRPN